MSISEVVILEFEDVVNFVQMSLEKVTIKGASIFIGTWSCGDPKNQWFKAGLTPKCIGVYQRVEIIPPGKSLKAWHLCAMLAVIGS